MHLIYILKVFVTRIDAQPNPRNFLANIRDLIWCLKIFGRNICEMLTKNLPSSSFASYSHPLEHEHETSTEIFKVNYDCFCEKFDYLSLRDIASVGQTCKNLQLIAGQFYQENFFTPTRLRNGHIYSKYYCINITCFHKFMQSIVVETGDLYAFRFTFQSLKEIAFRNVHLQSTEYLQNHFSNLETLQFYNCEVDSDIHETFLNFCKKLKRLSIRDNHLNNKNQNSTIVGKTNDWLKHQYPTLKYFELNSCRKMVTVIEFLKLNRNIRKFSTTIEFLIENMDSIASSKIKLKTLSILHAFTNMDNTKFDTFVNQLFKLQKHGLFKQLDLYFISTARKYTYPVQLLPFVTLLHISSQPYQFSVSSLSHLKELYLSDTKKIENFNVSSNNPNKLNHIYVFYDSIENILEFIKSIKCLPKLKTIQLDIIKNCTHFNEHYGIINLKAINDELAQFKNSAKITIYVREQIYLATKLAFKQMKLDLIELKRYESCRISHDFQSFFEG